jgi:hypothetical protein
MTGQSPQDRVLTLARHWLTVISISERHGGLGAVLRHIIGCAEHNDLETAAKLATAYRNGTGPSKHLGGTSTILLRIANVASGRPENEGE